MDLLKMHQAIAPETVSAARDATFMDVDIEVAAMDAETANRILELSHKDAHRAAHAAQYIFERAHTSNPQSIENKVMIGRSNAIVALCRLLDSPSDICRFQACSALSELAFCDENNCRAIIATPGCLESIVNLLQISQGSTQCDAALVINNCAAFCTETCISVVHYPGMLDAIQALATSGITSSKNVAVGAINSLSRCAAVRQVMVNANVVDTLAAVLSEEGSGDQYEARIARAAMGVANLQGHELCALGVENFESAIASICKIMGYALEERSWAGIFFAPYSVCLPLYNLFQKKQNRDLLVKNGLVSLLAEQLRRWKAGHHAEETLWLCMLMGEQLLLAPDDDTQIHLMAESRLVEAVQTVEAGLRGESAACVDAARRITRSLRERHEAVWMCQNARLGMCSRMHLLDESVTGMIVEMAMI